MIINEVTCGNHWRILRYLGSRNKIIDSDVHSYISHDYNKEDVTYIDIYIYINIYTYIYSYIYLVIYI